MIDLFALYSSPEGPDAPSLIDGPFVPRNLISAKDNPVPLLPSSVREPGGDSLAGTF